ncbi:MULTISPECIES: hypothetical protein [Agrobacterium]|uniref:hypothetical protein n=1 Tax=Agrobacterium TaxID=357 RepID=UPI0009BBF343|nr:MULTISPECIES: hypothetical protein [Agrobacterium]QCL77411.1 hypothetical protein CFBP5499_28570 [Agrobacterium tumefaciens]CUX72184.1 membrane hypothetical protein [Agrobacterium sp. NCPPB 925]
MLADVEKIIAAFGKTGLAVAATAIIVPALSLGSKLIKLKSTTELARKDREAKFFSKEWAKTALLQLEFERAFGTSATVPEIKAILAHETDILGMARAFGRGCAHVEWDGTWFSFNEPGAFDRQRVRASWFFVLTALCAVAVPIVAVWSFLLGEKGLVTIGVAGTPLMLMAAYIQFRDLLAFNAARQLVKGKPQPSGNPPAS